MSRTAVAAQDPNRSGDDIDPSAVRLPEGFALADAAFVQSGSDLLVSSADGVDVLVRGFFASDPPPDLVSSSGVQVAGSLVAAVADEDAPVELGEALFGGGVHAIGQVSLVNGTLSVIHADGTRDTLEAGDPIYPRDILEAGSDSTASIALGDSTIFSLGIGGRVILRPAAPDLGDSGEPVTLAAGRGEYAFACGAVPRSIVVDTPAGQIRADGADLVLSYLETGGFRIILIPGADGSVGDAWIENEAGSFHLTLAYQLVLVESAVKAPDPQGLVGSDDIIAGFGRILGSLPSSCDFNPLVAAARAAELDMADLAGDSGDQSEEDLQALGEFETAAGDEATGDTTFTDAKVIVTEHDPLAGDSAESSAVLPLPADTWIRPPRNTESSGSGAGNSNEPVINSLLTEGDVQRFNFVDPPDARPPVIANLSVPDWDAGFRQWKVIVPQEPSEYEKGIFYDKVTQYDEPRATVFRPQGPDDIETQYVPTSGGNMLLMSAGPLTGVTETGRGAKIEFIEQQLLNMPLGTLPKDIDTRFLVDGAAMKASNSVSIGASETKTISFDWAFDAQDEATFDDYAVFIVNGEWFKLSDNESTGAFGSSGWRRSEFEYTAANQENLTIGFAVINDANNSNDPRLLIDNVRLNEPMPADFQEIEGAPAERGGTPLPGEAQLRTFALPPTAEPDVISTSENIARSVADADLLANDSDPNAVNALTVNGLNDSGTLGKVSFSDSRTIFYDPNGKFESLAEGEQTTDSFEYEIINLSGIRDVAMVTVTITGVNDGPMAADDAAATDEGSPVAAAVSLLGNDSDPDNGDILTVSAVNSVEVNVGAEIALESGALLTVNADGTFVYDPNARFESLAAGERSLETFTYAVRDSHGGADTATVTVAVLGVNDDPTAADDTITANEDNVLVSPVSLLSNDNDPDGSDVLTVTSVNGTPANVGAIVVLASGALLTIEADGRFSLDPSGRFDGLSLGEIASERLTYTVGDGNGGTDTANVAVEILGANDEPTATAVTSATDEDAGTFSVDLLDGTITSDVDLTDSLVIARVTQNVGDSDHDLGDSFALDGGILSFDIAQFNDLAVGQNATVVFDYTVNDQRGQSNSTATNTVTISIEGRNDAPTAEDDRYTVSEDDIVTETALNGLLASDRDPDNGDTLRISGVNGLPGVVGSQVELTSGAFITVNADGGFTYDQNGRFHGLRNQEIVTDSFDYTLSDEYGGTDSGTVTFTIVGQNDAPQARDDAITAGEDVIVPATSSESVLANDSDPEGNPLFVTPFEGTSVLGARVIMADDGSYSYDPTVSAAIQALSDGETLSDSFVYELADSDGATDSATVTITVEGANDAPEASDLSFRTFKGSVLEVDAARGVLLNDSDLDGSDVLTLAAVNGEAADVGSQVVLPSGALLTVNADGTFSYDPDGRYDGLRDQETATDSFSYTVSDGAGLTDTATVSLSITGFKEQLVGSFDRDLAVWNSAGSVDRVVNHLDLEDGESRYGATDGPNMAVLEANGASVSLIETRLGLPSGALPDDTDLTGPVNGAATWTEMFVKTGDQISFDWNFDSAETSADSGPNDYAVFTVSDGTVSKVFKLSDVREAGGPGASGWRTFSYDPTTDFDIDTAGVSLTLGFAVVNDQNADHSSRLLVDNVRIAWELPAPVNDVFTVNADVPLLADPNRSLMANDRDASDTGTLTISAVNPTDLDDGTENIGAPITLASGAVLTVNPDGTFSLDPSDAAELGSLSEGEVFIDEFTYSIADGNDRTSLGTALVEIRFVGVNDTPVAENDRAFTDEHSVVRISTERLLANDSDPDSSDALKITAVDGSGATGSVTLGDDGFILYDPDGRFSDLTPGDEAVDIFRYTVEDENGGASTATVSVRVVGQADPPAPLGQILSSFETVPLGEWDPQWDRIKPVGSEPVSIVTEYSETDGAGGAFSPTSGDQMVVLEASGSFEDPVTSVADFLGVPALPSDSDGTRPADGSAMRTTIEVKAGDEISFDWMFDARDQSAGGAEVFNDYAVLTVSGPDGQEVFKLADVRQTGDHGASGWRTSRYVAANDGEVTLGFAVMNDAISHGPGDPRISRLLVDNVRLDREFGDRYQRLDGGSDDAFQTWVQPPSAGDDAIVTSEDTPLTIPTDDLLANDSPPNMGGSLGISDVDATGAIGVVTRGADGAIGYDPGGAFESLGEGETATDTFFYTLVGENGGTARAQVSVTVQGVNDAPVAQNDTVYANEDTAIAGNVLIDNGEGGDSDVDTDPVIVTRVNGAAANVGSQIVLASGALLLVNADGAFSYDPDGRFEFLDADDQVTDAFTYTVDDGEGGTATATVSVLVTGINDAPVANDDASSTSEDTAIAIDLIGNDVDPETASPVLAGLNDSATVGSLTPNGDGSVTYDPSGRFDFLAEGEVATDTFKYTIEDGDGVADTASVKVKVVGVNDAPVAENDTASTSEDTPVVIAVLDNDSDAEGDPLSITGLDDSGTLGRVSLNGDGTVSYDPDGRFDALVDGETATDTFRYTVSDGNGETDVATVTVTVNGVDDGGAGNGDLVESFERPIDPDSTRGAVESVFRYDEPDGAKDEFSPTDGNSMAVLTASGTSNLAMEFFLGLSVPLPADFGDSSAPADGSALRLTLDVEEGDEISFDWMFDANDFVQPPLGDFARPGFNDFAVFAADGEWFNLSDIRQVFDESGPFGATGWRTSIYTAQSDAPLTIGFAVVNDDTQEADSHLLVDNIRINRDFGSDSYTVVRSDPSGPLETVDHNPDV